MKKIGFLALALIFAVASIIYFKNRAFEKKIVFPEEKHFKRLKQLTFGGENAEAYFSYDEKKLIFQSTREGRKCDQIYTMKLDGTHKKMVSTGQGRTTCSYFLKNEERIIYSSTHLVSSECPPKPDFTKGYVWPLDDYDIFSADLDGKSVERLTETPGYDAEATLSPDGTSLVFTSIRDGDLNIYTMDLDGKNVKKLTHELGYDGGAFFSFDGKMIVYRAYHPQTQEEITDYKNLLKENKIRPMNLHIFVMDRDGSNKKQVTNLTGANFAPFFHPDDKRIIFSSNHKDPKGRNFDLFIINIDGSGLEQITFSPSFDGFPMFTRDGKKLVFASNRNAELQGETNIFLADWKNE
ncbi:MAG: TolB family protein [Deltaproteobacteria bacterium]|nr:TolB family protein [Deltaproteobacteria bacterium]